MWHCPPVKSCSDTFDLVAVERNGVLPFSRKGGPNVACWVQAIGRSQVDRFSTVSIRKAARLQPGSRMLRVNRNWDWARVVFCVSVSPLIVISYSSIEASPCTVIPAAASASEGPPKTSRHRLWPRIPDSSLLSALSPYSGCAARLYCEGSIDGQGGNQSGLIPVSRSVTAAIWPPSTVKTISLLFFRNGVAFLPS